MCCALCPCIFLQKDLHSKYSCIYSIVYFVYIHASNPYNKRTTRHTSGQGVPLPMRKGNYPSTSNCAWICLTSLYLCPSRTDYGKRLALPRLARPDTTLTHSRYRELRCPSDSSRRSSRLRDTHLCRRKHRNNYPSINSDCKQHHQEVFFPSGPRRFDESEVNQ